MKNISVNFVPLSEGACPDKELEKVYKYKCTKCGFVTKSYKQSRVIHVYDEGILRGIDCFMCGNLALGVKFLTP